MRASVALSAALLLLGIGAQSAHAAPFGVAGFDGEVLDENGDEFSQAGGHPFTASTTIDFNTPPEEDPRRIVVDLPAGFVGNPEPVPARCTEAELADNGQTLEASCPPASQVGVAANDLSEGSFSSNGVFAMEAPDNRAAKFGINVGGNGPVHLFATVRRVGGEYRTRVVVENITQVLGSLESTSLTFWGVPGDPAHDPQRSGGGCIVGCTAAGLGLAEVPFLTNPTSCTQPGEGVFTDLFVESWQGSTDTASFESHNNDGDPLGPTGCENVPFDPEISLAPANTKADSPTGLDVELTVPEEGLLNPDGIAQAHLKRTEVTLPEGMAINPSAADGLGACSPAQIDLEGDSSPRCPDSSKIGTVEIESPQLDVPLEGSAFLAEQDNNPFDSNFAVYLVAEARGVVIKLPGEITPDEQTGRLTTTFDDNPELPFESLRVRFKGGARAPLVNPPTCGTKQVTTEMSPWSAADPDDPTPDEVVTDTDSFAITSAPNGQPCSNTLSGRPFGPDLSAGVVNPVAGSSSPFVLRLTRPDGHQEIDSMEVRTPPGLAANLSGIPTCSDSQAENGSCPAVSRIGTSIVGAGAGSSPFFVRDGEVFLAGPYKGAALSLAIEVPAVAGPFDLGTVNVRAAVHVDPRTAQLTVKSDPIPRILEGIPLRVRDIRVRIDRPDFMVAPTNCDPMRVEATVRGSHGRSAEVSDRFQVGECANLGFDPKLRFQISGKKATKRSEHPALTATLTPNEGEANISRVRVALPKGMLLDQANIANICTRPQYAANECPANSIFGHAVAHTPLLEGPVEGNVYLRSSDNPLPDLVADLQGTDHPIEIDFVGEVDSVNNRIRNDFTVAPDVPVSDFELRIEGGPEGLLVNSRDICTNKKLRKTNVGIWAHNAKTAHQKPKLKAKACKKGKAKRLEQRAKRLKAKARREARRNNDAKAKRLRTQAEKLERRASRINRRLERRDR